MKRLADRVRQIWGRPSPDLVVPLLLLLLVGAYFWPWLRLRAAFFEVDIAFMDHPLRVHAFELLRSGRFPLWTQNLVCGFPLVAEGQAGILYPLSWLYLLLPPVAALDYFVVAHYALLVIGSYLYLRSLNLRPTSCAFGTLTLAYSSYMLVEHVLMGLLSVVAWMPYLLWLQLRFLRGGSHRLLAGSSCLIALLHLAGAPLETLMVLGLWSLVGLVAPDCSPRPTWRRRLAAVLFPLCAGTLLASVQLIPTLEFLRESTRSAGAVAPRAGFLPDAALLTLVSPRFLGLPGTGYVGPVPPGWEETLFLFVGWAPLMMIMIGALRRRTAAFWTILVLAAPALALQAFYPLSRWFWMLPPLVLFRWPARILLWYVVGAAVLAARGYETVLQDAGSDPRLRRQAVAVTLGGLLPGGLLWWFRGAFLDARLSASAKAGVLEMRDADLAILLVTWTLLGAAIAVSHLSGVRRALAPLCFAVLVAGVMCGYRPGGIPPSVYREGHATAELVRGAQGEGGRMLSLIRWGSPQYATDEASMRERIGRLPANAHLLYGLRSIEQFDLPWTTTLRRNAAYLAEPTAPLLGLLGVNVLLPDQVSSGDGNGKAAGRVLWQGFTRAVSPAPSVLARERPLARAFLVRQWVVEVDPSKREQTITDPSIDLRDRVVLERPPSWPPIPRGVVPTRDSVRFVEDGLEVVDLRVEAREDCLLVLADSLYPGWRAYVDGTETEIYAADGFVRAVAIPAGTRRVVFRYRPVTFWLGSSLSLVGLLALGLWLLPNARRRRRDA